MTRTQVALPETNLQVIEHLHAYRFLTAPQLVRLGVASHINSLRRTLRRFETSRKRCLSKELSVKFMRRLLF